MAKKTAKKPAVKKTVVRKDSTAATQLQEKRALAIVLDLFNSGETTKTYTKEQLNDAFIGARLDAVKNGINEPQMVRLFEAVRDLFSDRIFAELVPVRNSTGRRVQVTLFA